MVSRSASAGITPGGMPASSGQMQQASGNPSYSVNHPMGQSIPNRQQMPPGSAGALMSNGAPVMRRGSTVPAAGPSYPHGVMQVSYSTVRS